MTFDKLKEMFISMMDEDFDASGVDCDTKLKDDLCFTSLHTMWMAFAIEQEFGVDISQADPAMLTTVGAVCDYIDANKQ